jgi:hypothetical protein
MVAEAPRWSHVAARLVMAGIHNVSGDARRTATALAQAEKDAALSGFGIASWAIERCSADRAARPSEGRSMFARPERWFALIAPGLTFGEGAQRAEPSAAGPEARERPAIGPKPNQQYDFLTTSRRSSI